MDDLKILNDGWQPPAPPSDTAYSQARAALLERATTGSGPRVTWRGFRLPRMGVRLVAVGALAVTIAAGVTVAQNLGGVDKNGRPRAAVPGLPAGPVANAQEVLYRAADSAQARAFTAPRNDQWTYIESRNISPGKPLYGEVQTPKTPLKTKIDRTWTRADGKQVAFFENGKLVVSPSGGAMPPQDYASVAALPRDPDALLAWDYKQGVPGMVKKDPRDSRAFGLLGGILRNNVLPPQLEATIYRALAKIPGVTLNKGAVDIAGRPALGVAYVTEGWMNQEILLDRKTYAYRGDRSIVVKDHTETISDQKLEGKDGKMHVDKGGTWTVKKGTIDVLSLRTAAGIVDKPGQRP